MSSSSKTKTGDEPTSETNRQPLPENPQEWKREHVLEYLRNNQDEYDLDTSDIETIRREKVAGRAFLQLTRKDLRETPYNLTDGAARAIEHLINMLRERQAPPSEFLRQQHPSATRKRRWEELNPVLNAVLNKKAKINQNTKKKTGSVAYYLP